jgi:general stress protein CsbA
MHKYTCDVTICNCLHCFVINVVKSASIGLARISWNQWNALLWAQQKLAWSAKDEYRKTQWIVSLGLQRCMCVGFYKLSEWQGVLRRTLTLTTLRMILLKSPSNWLEGRSSSFPISSTVLCCNPRPSSKAYINNNKNIKRSIHSVALYIVQNKP